MKFKIEIEVKTKDGVLNPESKTIYQALNNHGYAIESLVMNRKFYIVLDSNSSEEALITARKMSEELLANTIIQDFDITITDVV